MRRGILVKRVFLATVILFLSITAINVIVVSRTLQLDMRKVQLGVAPPPVQLHSGGVRGARVVFDNQPRSFCEPFPILDDADGDGLDAKAEFLQQTSDRNPDTDGDGINDKDDFSPNGFIDSYRGEVLSLVVASHLETVNPRPGQGHVYVQTQLWESGRRVSVDYLGAKTVNIHQMGFLYLPDFAATDWNLIRTQEAVFIPGLLYVYESYLYCGPRCADHRLFFLTHLPFFGPVLFWAK